MDTKGDFDLMYSLGELYDEEDRHEPWHGWERSGCCSRGWQSRMARGARRKLDEVAIEARNLSRILADDWLFGFAEDGPWFRSKHGIELAPTWYQGDSDMGLTGQHKRGYRARYQGFEVSSGPQAADALKALLEKMKDAIVRAEQAQDLFAILMSRNKAGAGASIVPDLMSMPRSGSGYLFFDPHTDNSDFYAHFSTSAAKNFGLGGGGESE